MPFDMHDWKESGVGSAAPNESLPLEMREGKLVRPLPVIVHALDIRSMMGADIPAAKLEKVPLRYCLLADRRRGDDGLLALATGILLSECLGITQDAQLIFDPTGKPYVLGKQYKLSIAHAGYVAAVSTCEQPVGVDVEPVPGYTEQAHVKALESIYGKGKVDRKAVLSIKSGPETFCRMWTHAEAACKCDGIDLASARRDNPEFPANVASVTVPYKGHLITVVAKGDAEVDLRPFDFTSWL